MDEHSKATPGEAKEEERVDVGGHPGGGLQALSERHFDDPTEQALDRLRRPRGAGKRGDN